MQIKPTASALGAEVSGLDLSTELAPQQLRAVHMALADYPDGAARRLLRKSIIGNCEGRPLTSATA
jgi:hypothetical protein